MTMPERVQDLWERHNIHISISGLRLIYKRHGIRRRQCRQIKKDKVRRASELDKQRRQAAEDLVSLLQSGQPILYVDET